METLNSHPTTAAQAKAFTAPSSLSFPGGHTDMSPPSSEKDGSQQATSQQPGSANGNGVTPATPAATPAAGAGVSGIVPTLQ